MSEMSKAHHYHTVLFDMDGTLLDLAFDTYIWMQQVPQIWAKQQNISLEEAKQRLYQFYLTHQGSLNWYSCKFWQQQLNIDVLALQHQHKERIQARSLCFELLEGLKQRNIDCWLVTNADCSVLQLKLDNIPFASYFSHIVSSESLGAPKEEQAFWQNLQQQKSFDPKKCILVDDNYDVLKSAETYGIGKAISIAEPDSSQPRKHTANQYAHLHQLTDLLDLWALPLEQCGT